ncbi:hypothetical protein GCM10022224_053050 [Nonomuraea antimicrobica]|uniref:Uncharacterized protein n=1 Tax=Nonomuraea antimicrobica TaxID=561173 RepID=A0ABP7CBS5_9ACTN
MVAWLLALMVSVGAAGPGRPMWDVRRGGGHEPIPAAGALTGQWDHVTTVPCRHASEGMT